MTMPFFPNPPAAGGRYHSSRYSRGLVLLAGIILLLTGPVAGATSVADKAKDDFMPYVQLAPFVIKGRQLAISIHARSNGDRRYAEEFAEGVVKVVYAAVTEETGKGLVIIGKKGEPHPVFVFRKVLALAQEGKLDPAVAARGPELDTMLNHWQTKIDAGKSLHVESDGGVDMEFEQILAALPLPLEGIGAKLYQLAWLEEFDDKRVEAKLRALRAADLEGNMFARFDWVFYLPPRGAFEQVLDKLIAEALKEEEAGFLARTAVKGVMLVVKPKIKKAIEGLRRGVMFSTVVRARTTYGEEQVSALTGAYIETMMPEEQKSPGTDHERAVKAVRDRLRTFDAKLAEPPADQPAEPLASDQDGKAGG